MRSKMYHPFSMFKVPPKWEREYFMLMLPESSPWPSPSFLFNSLFLLDLCINQACQYDKLLSFSNLSSSNLNKALKTMPTPQFLICPVLSNQTVLLCEGIFWTVSWLIMLGLHFQKPDRANLWPHWGGGRGRIASHGAWFHLRRCQQCQWTWSLPFKISCSFSWVGFGLRNPLILNARLAITIHNISLNSWCFMLGRFLDFEFMLSCMEGSPPHLMSSSSFNSFSLDAKISFVLFFFEIFISLWMEWKADQSLPHLLSVPSKLHF